MMDAKPEKRKRIFRQGMQSHLMVNIKISSQFSEYKSRISDKTALPRAEA